MNHPRLLIPQGAGRPHPQGMENARIVPNNDNKPRYNLPQEMKDEIRKHVPEAKEVAAKIQELLSKGNAAQVALVCQEVVRTFLGDHLKSLLPQMAKTFAQTDRMQLLNFFQQMCQERLSPHNLSAERIDKRSYELAVSDFTSLISRIPAQVFPIEVGLPDLDLESPEGETPVENTTPQGDS